MEEQLDVDIISTVHLDRNGYLLPWEKWDRNVGKLLSLNAGIGNLNGDHWRIIEYLRDYYLRFGMVPPVRKLIRDTGLKMSRIYELFPTGVAAGACKVAGIPGIVFEHPLTCLYP